MTIIDKKYQREIDAFIASRSGGGGFIRFGGFYRPWKWVIKNCRCARCNAPLGYHKTTIPADGLIANAVYFRCEGASKDPIRRESDLKWAIGAQARDERLRAQGKVKDVQEAYSWLVATVPQEPEVIPF